MYQVLDKKIYGICIGFLIIQQLNYCILVGLNAPTQEKTMEFSMLHRHLIFSFGYWYNRLGAWCKSPNKRILSYKDALHRTQCESIETTVRTRRLLWAGALLRMGDHRLPKRVMSGELENAGKRGPGGKEKEWTDCVADDLRLFGVTGDWKTAALDPGAWYNTVQEGGCRFMAAWVREEENASNQRQKKRDAGEADKVEVAPGVTVASLRRFRTALIGPTQGLPKRRRLCH